MGWCMEAFEESMDAKKGYRPSSPSNETKRPVIIKGVPRMDGFRPTKAQAPLSPPKGGTSASKPKGK